MLPGLDFLTIPPIIFFAFQMMFAIITPALIAGATADRQANRIYCNKKMHSKERRRLTNIRERNVWRNSTCISDRFNSNGHRQWFSYKICNHKGRNSGGYSFSKRDNG